MTLDELRELVAENQDVGNDGVNLDDFAHRLGEFHCLPLQHAVLVKVDEGIALIQFDQSSDGYVGNNVSDYIELTTVEEVAKMYSFAAQQLGHALAFFGQAPRQFLFVSNKGSEKDPRGKKAENVQVLGIGGGKNPKEAWADLLQKYPWVQAAGWAKTLDDDGILYAELIPVAENGTNWHIL